MHKDICEHAWMCDSAYDAAVYYAQPPPSCPNPAPGTTPPPIPGKCIFNLIASKCQFTGKGECMANNYIYSIWGEDSQQFVMDSLYEE